MEQKYKRTILVDLDGVLNKYNGKYDDNYIPEIKEGAYDFIKELSEQFKVVIFTTRNRLKASKWIFKNKLDEFVYDVTNVKEPSYLIIDDRCLNFKGDFDEIKNQISNFEVWYKK